MYDGDQIILDLNGNNSVRTEYGYQADGQAVPYSIKEDSAGGWTGVAVIDPAVGTLLGIANYSGGGLIKQYAPDPWGRQTTVDTGVKVRLRMAGQEYDAETGLYHMGARYYDPDAGRFLSEDPLGIAGGLNLYRYASNNPVLHRDPTGLDDYCYYVEVEDPTTASGDIHVMTETAHSHYELRCTSSYSQGGGDDEPGPGANKSGGGAPGTPGFDPTPPKRITCAADASLRALGVQGEFAIGVGKTGSTGSYAAGGEGGTFITKGSTIGVGGGVGFTANVIGTRRSFAGTSSGGCLNLFISACVTHNAAGFNVALGFGVGFGAYYEKANTVLIPQVGICVQAEQP